MIHDPLKRGVKNKSYRAITKLVVKILFCLLKSAEIFVDHSGAMKSSAEVIDVSAAFKIGSRP